MGELPLGAERSLVDCLSPSAITEVEATDMYVRVALGVEGDSDKRVAVSVHRSIEDVSKWLPHTPEIRWSGNGRTDIAHAENLAETLRQAVAVARVLERVIEKPNAPVLDIDERAANADWQMIQKGLIWHMSDYALCLWILMHGGKPWYSRQSRSKYEKGIDGLDGLREEAFRIAAGIEVVA